jgi:hypothetical protein
VPDIRANGVPAELLERVDVWRAKRGRMTMKDAAVEAFEVWIAFQEAGGKIVPREIDGPASAPEPILTAQEAEIIREAVALFSRVLHHRNHSEEPAYDGAERPAATQVGDSRESGKGRRGTSKAATG